LPSVRCSWWGQRHAVRNSSRGAACPARHLARPRTGSNHHPGRSGTTYIPACSPPRGANRQIQKALVTLMKRQFTIQEASIEETLHALEAGQVSAVELVAAHLARIGRFDRSTVRLNAVAVLNPEVFAQAAASDAR